MRAIFTKSLLSIGTASLLVGCASSSTQRRVVQPEMRFLSSAAYAYRGRVLDQIAVDALEHDAVALRFRFRSAIMRQRLGEDDVLTRESWAVPAGILTAGGQRQLAIVTTRCVLDYRYPLQREMPHWSNLALFSSPGLQGRQDVERQVFRINYPRELPGTGVNYDPKHDAWVYTSRRYLEGPAGDRYFGPLSNGTIQNGWSSLPVGNWNDTSGVDLAIVYLPLSDPGVIALHPERNLGMVAPEAALKAILESRTRLWGDTFRFDLVSQECTRSAAADYQDMAADAERWRSLAIAAGALLAVAYIAPTFAVIDSELIEQLGEHVVKTAVAAMWRSAAAPVLGSSVRGASWNQFGKLVLQIALENGVVQDFVVAGLTNVGLGQESADAIIGALQQVLANPSARIATMERANGPGAASIMLPSAQDDFAADLIRRGLARLDTADTDVLKQQPTLLKLAQDAIADPDVHAPVIQDDAYRRVLRDLAMLLAR